MTTAETTIDTGTNELLCVIRDRVAVITLNRPEARNALSDHLTPALRTMIKTCGENPDVGALLITGAGTAFCAGGDVKGMGAHRDKKKLDMSYDEKVADLQERQRLLTGALISVRKPTIAALPGPAAGAGLAIAMACDIRIAAESAFVSTGYLRVGLSGDYGIAWLLTRLVGTSRARELMFTADKVDAARCETIGLVNRVVPDAKLQDEAFALAKSMAEGPTIALRYMKDNLDEALLFDFATARDHEAERLIRTTMTADHREAVQAFIEKRKAGVQGQLKLRGMQIQFAEAPLSGDPRPRQAASSRRECPSARRRSCFSKRTSFQSSGVGAKAKPDLRASPIIDVVGAQGIAEQALGAERGRAAFQIPQQRRADALALPAVVDRQAEFEARRLGFEPVAGFADDGLEAVDRHESRSR